MRPTIVPITPRKALSARRVLLLALAADVVLVPLAVWSTVESGQWTPVIGLLAWHVVLPVLPRMRRAVRRNVVEHLSVSGGEIVAVTGRGGGSALTRSNGDLVRVRHTAAGQVLKVVGPAGGETGGMVVVDDVDPEALRRALLEHGWSLQEGEHGPVIAPDPTTVGPAEAAAGTTLVLREGVAKVGARSPISWILLGLGLLPALPAVLSGSTRFLPVLPPWGLFLFVVWVVIAVAAQSREITVGPERISYRAGTVTQIADRARVGALALGPRYLRVTDSDGRQVLWLPLKWRRAELVELLRAQGWPISGAAANARRPNPTAP